MKNPFISVIIPVYKVEEYIEQCCRSVFSQTYNNFEVIIVDDGTPDRSVEIVENLLDGEFAAVKHRVRIIRQENKGLPAVRKVGVRNASGDYIIQFDSDDWVATDMLEKLAAATYDDPDVVICNYYNTYKYWKIPRREKQYPDKYQILDAMFSHRHFRAYLWNKLVKRSIYEGEEFLFPRYGMCEDMVIMAQVILRAQKIRFIKDKLYYYRKTNVKSLSKQRISKRNREVILNKLDLWDFYEKSGDNSLEVLKDNYLLQVVWMAFHSNLPELLDDREEMKEYVKTLSVDPKRTLEVKNQARLKDYIHYYELYKKTGDPSLIPKFHSDIKDKHSKEQPE